MLKSSQFSAFNSQWTSLLETNLSLMNAWINGYKQAATLQCDTAKALLNEGATALKNICAASSISEVPAHMQAFATSSVETGIAKGQELFKLMNDSKEQLASKAVDSFKDVSATLAKSVDQLAAFNPNFSKAASESLQTILTTAGQGRDALVKASTELGAAAAKNFEATLTAVKKATKTTGAH